MKASDLIKPDDRGLACAPGGFHIDPWKPVDTAVITHAHGDHARFGSKVYYCAAPGAGVLRRRMWNPCEIRPMPYGEAFRLGDASVSFHPAGHVLGSAQVRVEVAGDVWVVSGDYKRGPDPTCEPFEVVPCGTFISEATFALPIYRWDPPTPVIKDILDWWLTNRQTSKVSVLFSYALGKAQRLLGALGALAGRTGLPEDIYVHGALAPMIEAYREAGIDLPPTRPVADTTKGKALAGALVLAPPSAAGSRWMQRFRAGAGFETGFASGWMRVRGIRRRMGYDRGFVVSDHADWHDLVRTVKETGASRVIATHGYSDILARHLRDLGLETGVFRTAFKGEEVEDQLAAAPPD